MRRTPDQNRAMHLYFRMLAEALNDAGYDMKAVFAVKEVEVPWTEVSVKECLWKPIEKAMMGKQGTSDLNVSEVSPVYEVLARHMSEHFGVVVEFPSKEQVRQSQGG